MGRGRGASTGVGGGAHRRSEAFTCMHALEPSHHAKPYAATTTPAPTACDQPHRTLLRHQLRDKQEVPKQRLVALLGATEAREAVAGLRDHQKVHRGLRLDVAQRKALVVLVDDVGLDLLGDDLVKDGGGVAVGLAAFLFLGGGKGSGGGSADLGRPAAACLRRLLLRIGW